MNEEGVKCEERIKVKRVWLLKEGIIKVLLFYPICPITILTLTIVIPLNCPH